ncbi:TRAP transporter large permease subunit [Litoribrevibacter euphylliae]|uniref:TRAP transporter large permease subunit n=1 Tax=Litoribrevibacter euphylliae TaxID=1834034 RepID=A0ABV7HHK5_9GAMM
MNHTHLSSNTLQFLGGLALSCVLLIGISSGLQERLFSLGSYLWPNYAELSTTRSDATDHPSCNPSALTSEEDQLLLDDLLGATETEPLSTSTPQHCVEPSVASHQTNSYEDPAYPEQSNAHWLKGLEQNLQSLNLWLTGHQSLILSVFILVSLLSATRHKKHLCLAPDEQRSKTSLIAQILSSLLITHDCFEYALHLLNRNYLSDNAYAYLLLALAFGLNALLCCYYLAIAQPLDKTPVRSKRVIRTLKSIPIYSWMILLSVALDKERTDHELALLIGQIYEMPLVYLQIGLYIWLGMLIKHSKLGETVIDLVVCLARKPQTIAICLVAFMAIPTAFTGASGIIILAMGGLVYQSLKKLPLRRQFILAITAMTGSTGVVLAPSLLIVAIAFLNKEVTTGELFYWGSFVFGLTLSLLILIVKLLPAPTINQTRTVTDCANTNRANTDPTNTNITKTATKTSAVFRACLPYLLTGTTITLALQFLFGLSFNEFTAPYFLILLLLGLLVMESFSDRKHTRHKPISSHEIRFTKTTFTNTTYTNTTFTKVRKAIAESFEHSGAILLVMFCSYSLGNTSFNPGWLDSLALNGVSLFSTLSMLLILLIVIGMILDPFGALILVSMTLAPFAYEQGINPIHFWMITLVAFELAYVTPPVAMNHLLTRQQVSESEWFQLDTIESDTMESETTASGIRSFYLKHERVLLPILVLGSSLLIVTFVPIWFY